MIMPYTPLQVMSMMTAERKRQDEKWGEQNHTNGVWALILGEEFGESCQAALDKSDKEVVQELIQVAAVCIAWIEAIGRKPVVDLEKGA
jgi:hypothetical protein